MIASKASDETPASYKSVLKNKLENNQFMQGLFF